MALQDIPKKKTRPLDPKFNVEIKPARKKATANRMIAAVSGGAPAAKKAAVKPAPKSGPMRRPTMADRIQDAKNIQPKGPAKPNATKKAPATGMKIIAKKAAAKKIAKAVVKKKVK